MKTRRFESSWTLAWKGERNFRKCAGLLVAQITSLTEGCLLLSEDPVRGGKMEWSQEKEGKGKTAAVKKDPARTRRGVGLWPGVTTPHCLPKDSLLSTRRSKWQIDVRLDRTIYSLPEDKRFLTKFLLRQRYDPIVSSYKQSILQTVNGLFSVVRFLYSFHIIHNSCDFRLKKKKRLFRV